ncbi:sialate O-acetylesterase [Rhizobium giardinii]|uniref:sialate O-acetylesterase n=1 Tax=Rhizobium giardinii TaxID=56731 RepID=UPI0039E0D092
MLSISSMTGNGTVFQRGRPIVIMGTSTPLAIITVTHGTTQIGESVVGKGGDFRISCTELPTGGPYDLQVSCGTDTATVTGVFVGDVWLVAGQSNPNKTLTTTLRESVRSFGSARPKMTFMYPETAPVYNYTREEWHRTGDVSRIGSVFANTLNSATGIPIGIIRAAFPGAPIQKFYNSDAYNQENGGGVAWVRNMPADALAMDWVYPFAGLSMKGVLWWQGESNIPAHEYYAGHLQRLMARWRLIFNRPDLYFAVIGLQNIVAEGDDYLPADQAQLRTAQRAVADADGNAVWIKTDDLTPTGDLHPPDDEVNSIAQRAANAVRTRLYV